MTLKYSFWKGLLKSFISAVIFAIPLVALSLPNELLELTLGGFLILVVNFLKVKAAEAGMIK